MLILTRNMMLGVLALVLWKPVHATETGPAALPPDLKHERDMALATLVDASIRFDVPGLEFARKRFMALSKKPAVQSEALFFLAFTDWQLATNGVSDPEIAKTHLHTGLSHLTKILADQPGHGEAYLLQLRFYYLQAQLDPENSGQLWPLYGQAINKARSLLPDHPVTLLNLGLTIFHGPQPDHAKGVELMQMAKTAFEQSPDRSDPHWVFWYTQGCAWLGNHYLMLEQPEIEKAKAVFQTALAMRPDHALIRDTLLPSTETLVFCAASEVAGKQWTTLATDDEGDGMDQSLADGKTLAYAYDEEKDMLWFQFAFFQMPSENGFGVNLVADTDGTPENGVAWWGAKRDFRFDRLVTVWVARGANGQYAGTVGVGEAADVMRGSMTGIARNNIAFTVDQEAKTITIGLKRELLVQSDKVRLIGAVGSNSRWNDDLIVDHALNLNQITAR